MKTLCIACLTVLMSTSALAQSNPAPLVNQPPDLFSQESLIAAAPQSWFQAAELHGANGRFSRYLGISTAAQGNTLVVGASHNAGEAYVFVEPPSGWSDVSARYTLISSDEQPGDYFGQSVTISGDTVVVGAVGFGGYKGAAYVFAPPKQGQNNKAITETAKLTASDGQPGDEFGSWGAVSIVGNIIAIGAPLATIGPNQRQGAVYIFVEPKGGWRTMTETIKLTASEGAAYDSFGISTGLSSDTLAVGAYDANQAQGKVYVFNEVGGQVKQVAELTASDGAAGDLLGISVSVSSHTVVAGAPLNDNGTGAAYLFVEPESGWMDMTQTAKLTASDGKAGARMEAVSILASSVVAGAAESGPAGAAYLFVEPAGGWTDMTETAEFGPSDGQLDDGFGASVAVTADTVFSGSPGHFIAPDFYGATYVFSAQ